jgi:hypothetical protein
LKKVFFLLLLLFCTISMTAHSAALSEQYQLDLLERLTYLQGQGPLPASMSSIPQLPHCGTSIAFEAFINRPAMTEPYKSAAAQLEERPDLPYSYASPGNHFRVHYTTTGINAVYEPTKDTIVAGIPNYVYKTAQIADSVWAFEINHLGFPAPPSDGFYTAGGDSLLDIYIIDMGSGYYGATYGDYVIDNQTATSWIEIDNDYNFYPYTTRPLDAVRVTLAHEFFHTIHFGMDWSEYEGDGRMYWWEMSATWMEEMVYDNINDYYGYLPDYFDYPWISLQDFSTAYSLHPYASMLFPLFLTQKWDTIVVRDIWELCRDMGVGPNFLNAADSAISLVSDGEYHLRDAFQEFAIWNLFTGSRASRAPTGYRYEEATNYPLIPDSVFITHTKYPFRMLWLPGWPDSLIAGPDSVVDIPESTMDIYKARYPRNLSANYINWTAIQLIPDSLIFNFQGLSQQVWNFSIVGFPINSARPMLIKEYTQSGNNMIKDTLPTTRYNDVDIIYEYFAIPTAASLLSTAFTPQSQGVGYTYRVYDSALADTRGYVVRAPYPNPRIVNSDDDVITFSVDMPLLPMTTLHFYVTIFDIAGEKIKEIDSTTTVQDKLVYRWHLDNNSHKKVAAGVYLAYCRLYFDDNTPEIIKKYKLAVIK